MYDATALVVQDDEHEQEPKRSSRYDEEIDGRQTAHMVLKATWFRRNVRQVCDGGFGCRTMYLVTVAWLTSMPSFNNSPWMRGAPHNGFSQLIRWMSSRISFEVRGRPGFPWQDFHFQKRRNPWRCQPMTVSGLTMTRASFQRGHRRQRKTQNTRSSGRSHGRGLSRFRTATCWRRAMFSSCNVARLRTNLRTKATRITTIVCMLRTVAGSALECQVFRGRRGFEERQVSSFLAARSSKCGTSSSSALRTWASNRSRTSLIPLERTAYCWMLDPLGG